MPFHPRGDLDVVGGDFKRPEQAIEKAASFVEADSSRFPGTIIAPL
jgi:hypothetical protein